MTTFHEQVMFLPIGTAVPACWSCQSGVRPFFQVELTDIVTEFFPGLAESKGSVS